MKKILVTGATGFVGAEVARKLVNQGYEVHTLVRNTSSKARLVNIEDKIKFHICDLTDNNTLEVIAKYERFDTIYHFATFGGFHYEKDFRLIFDTNVVGLINLLSIFSRYGLENFISTSSSSEYGHKQKPMKEEDHPEPTTLYGISKVAATMATKLLSKDYGVSPITVRLFSPYGYFDGKTRFIPTVIKGSLLNEKIELNSPNSVRDYIFIEDVVDFYLRITDRPELKGEIFNLGSGTQSIIGEVAEIILRLSGRPSSLIKWEGNKVERQKEPQNWVADMNKAIIMTGWKPTTPIDVGLEKTISWFKENLWFYN